MSRKECIVSFFGAAAMGVVIILSLYGMDNKINQLGQENRQVMATNSALLKNSGRPITIDELPDGEYSRLDAESYCFIRRTSGETGSYRYGPIIGVRSTVGELPKNFVWKDGRHLDIKPY